MAEMKENPKGFSTCLEDAPFAEMMHRMIDRQGIGSLCAEMMKQVMEKKEEGGSCCCAALMQSLTKKRGGTEDGESGPGGRG